VFPVFGPRRSATRSAPTARDVAGKWHHGEDLVAPAGTPLLAVADGTLFSVGWNDIGGWRLWLRDDAGTSSTTRT
jgi:murein DD-endopeptidase MepM/ murein hydrolase activator NlpD